MVFSTVITTILSRYAPLLSTALRKSAKIVFSSCIDSLRSQMSVLDCFFPFLALLLIPLFEVMDFISVVIPSTMASGVFEIPVFSLNLSPAPPGILSSSFSLMTDCAPLSSSHLRIRSSFSGHAVSSAKPMSRASLAVIFRLTVAFDMSTERRYLMASGGTQSGVWFRWRSMASAKASWSLPGYLPEAA